MLSQVNTLLTGSLDLGRIVLSQLEGSGRGALGAYNAGSWQDLHDHLHNVPMKDGEKWLGMRLNVLIPFCMCYT